MDSTPSPAGDSTVDEPPVANDPPNAEPVDEPSVDERNVDAPSVDAPSVDLDRIDLDRVEQDLNDVQAALERLNDGDYWTDEVTGAALSDEFLANNPTARTATTTTTTIITPH